MPAFPTICSQLHFPSALKGNWERAVSRDPQHCWANWGHPFPWSSWFCDRGRKFVPMGRCQWGKKKTWFESWRGGTDSFVLHCPQSGGTQDRINFTSAIITHVVVMGKIWNRTGKSNGHPRAQPCILHLGPGSGLKPGGAQGSVAHSGLALVSVQAKDRPRLFQREWPWLA